MIQTGEFEANGIFYNHCLELTEIKVISASRFVPAVRQLRAYGD